MATMALQAPLRNSSLRLIAFLTIVLFSCSSENMHVYVADTGTNFNTRGGITRLSEKPFSGIRYKLFANGDTAYTYTYRNGKEHGAWTEWWSNGQMKEQRYFADGYKEGEHKGWLENGGPRFLYHFKKDLYEGDQKEWMETGQLFREMHYKNGQEEGMQRMYWPDGKLRANYQYVNGRKYGLTGVKNCEPVGADSTGR